jgi:hypothetical protein
VRPDSCHLLGRSEGKGATKLAETAAAGHRDRRLFLLSKGKMVFPMRTESLRLDWLVVGCLIHAGLVTALWLLVFKFEVEVLSGKIWMMLAMTWLLWPICALVSPRGVWKKRAIAGFVGILILAPTIPTLYTFIVWTVEGFAP